LSKYEPVPLNCVTYLQYSADAKATTAIALATLLPGWASTSEISGVFKRLDDEAVLPYGDTAPAEYA